MRNTHAVAIVIVVIAFTSGCYFSHRKIKAVGAEKHKLASSSNGAISKVKERREPFTQTELRSIFAKLEAGGEDEYFLHAKAVNCIPRYIAQIKGRYYALKVGKPSDQTCKSLFSPLFFMVGKHPMVSFEIDKSDFMNEWTQILNASVACPEVQDAGGGLKQYKNTAAHSILIPKQKARDENIEYTCENQSSITECMREPVPVAWKGLDLKTVLVAKRASHDEFVQNRLAMLREGYMSCLQETSKQVLELQEILRRAFDEGLKISEERSWKEDESEERILKAREAAFDTAGSKWGEAEHDEEPEEERDIQVRITGASGVRAGASCVGYVMAQAVVMLLLLWSA